MRQKDVQVALGNITMCRWPARKVHDFYFLPAGVPQGIFIFALWAKDCVSQIKHGKGSTCMYVVLENMMDNDLVLLTWTIPYQINIHFILATVLVLVNR